MQQKVIITDPKKFEAAKQSMKKDGADKFHVLADFDCTFTYDKINGLKSSSVIAQIRNGNYLTPEYAPRAHALYDKYAPMEKDPHLSFKEKNAAMLEWWKTHYALLAQSGLTKKIMDEIVSKRTLKFRDQALKLIDFLYSHDIPLVIMSAAPGYMLERYLAQEDRLYDNVHIIADQLVFDQEGKFISLKEPIVHSLNKYEIILKDFPIFKEVENRPNVLLLGDKIEDVGMIEGFPYKQLIKIGFLNETEDKIDPATLQQYQDNYDVVLTGDQDMGYINNLIREIFE